MPRTYGKQNGMLLAVVAAVAVATPAPLKEIGHVRATALCAALRGHVAPVVAGLRVNDRIIAQSEIAMSKVHFDALVDPSGNSAIGGAGDASEMDDFQMNALVTAMTANLAKVDALLADQHVFVPKENTDDERALNVAKARLEAVLTEQRRLLALLGATLGSNEAADLASKCDPVDCPAGGPMPERLGTKRTLTAEVAQEQQAESEVAPAIVDLVARCKTNP
ncbi:MAG: hypothetical protein WAN39_13770 [Candidatus Cybelea sp.]